MSKLKAPKGRIIVSIDMEAKNSHDLGNGQKLILARGVENFNRRDTMPVNAIVVDGEDLPEGTQVIVHHNCTHDAYRIFDYQPPTEESSSNVRYYSIPVEMVYIFKLLTEKDWKPCKGFATGLRIYEPYAGLLEILPTQIKKQLFITSGEHKNKACCIAHASDYCMIFQGDNGKEDQIIRVRHFEEEDNEREEILFVDPETTELVISGKYFVGLESKSAKKLSEWNIQ